MTMKDSNHAISIFNQRTAMLRETPPQTDEMTKEYQLNRDNGFKTDTAARHPTPLNNQSRGSIIHSDRLLQLTLLLSHLDDLS